MVSWHCAVAVGGGVVARAAEPGHGRAAGLGVAGAGHDGGGAGGHAGGAGQHFGGAVGEVEAGARVGSLLAPGCGLGCYILYS